MQIMKVMCHGEVDKKVKTKSLRFLIEALTKLGSFIDAYASTCDFV